MITHTYFNRVQLHLIIYFSLKEKQSKETYKIYMYEILRFSKFCFTEFTKS